MKNKVSVAGLVIAGLIGGFSARADTGSTISVYQTAMNSEQRLEHIGNYEFSSADQPLETEISVFVNPAKRFQYFLGVGGALTDASAEVFAKLPADKQAELLKAYYDPEEGIGYTLARTTIHSSDFSSEIHAR